MKMKIGLIDVDNWGKINNCFPNLPLMKISAFYKKHNYHVEWYDKEHIKRGAEVNSLARWVNTKMIFWKCPTFEQYKNDIKKGLWM